METRDTNMVSGFTNGRPGIYCMARTIYLVVASPLSDPTFWEGSEFSQTENPLIS